MTKKNEQEIKKVREKLKVAKERQAAGIEFAGDYLELDGVKFYKPTMAHLWLFERMKHSVQCTASFSDFGVCVAYGLAHKQEDVRNKLMAQVTKGQLVDKAYAFVSAKEIQIETVDEVLKKLAYKVLKITSDDDQKKKPAKSTKKKPLKKRAKGSSPSGGPQ